MAAEKKVCVTHIPANWPKFTGPAYRDGMSVSEATRLWHGFLRIQSRVHPNPPVYSVKGER